ncbi:GAF domain-containing sensor histidine kinase, partial [Psychrosphaera sp.]|nr:GAF domain-containing sensor histidine kinase [Psychrosphaera sp.]
MYQSDKTHFIRPDNVSDKDIIASLIDISKLITEKRELQALYKRLHVILSKVTFVKNIAIAEVDSVHHSMTINYFVDEMDGNLYQDKSIDIGNGLSSYAIKAKRPIKLHQTEIIQLQDDGVIDQIYGTMCHSWIGIPITNEGEVFGLIIVQSYSPELIYTDRDLEILSFAGSNINILMQHKRIEEQDKLIREEMLQKDKMASLGQLVAGVAHEINTPLGVCVTGISNLYEEHKVFKQSVDAGSVTEKQFNNFVDDVEETCEIIKNNVARAATLISSFKQVAVDQSSETMRLINIKNYINEVVQSLNPLINKTNHKIIVSCPNNIELETQPGAISQLLTNLITNSIIHGFENIDEGEINLDINNRENGLEFIYKDNGQGMNEEQRIKFFDPFYTTKRNSGGSGLGGHIIFNIVATALNGSIKL